MFFFVTILNTIQTWGMNPSRKISLWAGSGKRNANRCLLYEYAPEKKNGVSVIVCPGGSYGWLGMKVEGEDVAEWLNAKGVTVFVLRYRLGTKGNHYPDQQSDIQMALHYVASNADSMGLDPARVGVMGFSAGGHLSGSICEYFDRNFIADAGIGDDELVKPFFGALIYPVISMTEEYSHKRSCKYLLGKKAGSALRDSMSLERHVRADMPPQFVVCCEDDPTVVPTNSKVYVKALDEMGVPNRFLLYDESGHGFGISTEDGRNNWCEEFEKWLDDLIDRR